MYAYARTNNGRACSGRSPRNSKVRIIWNGPTYRECTQWMILPAVSRSSGSIGYTVNTWRDSAHGRTCRLEQVPVNVTTD